MAGRYRMPSALGTSHNISKSEREEMADMEAKLSGGSNKLEEVPDWIDELAQQYYVYIIKELEIANILCNLDLFVVTQTAQALSDIQHLTEQLNKEGLTIVVYDKAGNERLEKHPAYAMRDLAHKQFKSLALQLGLSPTARSQLVGLQIQKKEDDTDPVLRLLQK